MQRLYLILGIVLGSLITWLLWERGLSMIIVPLGLLLAGGAAFIFVAERLEVRAKARVKNSGEGDPDGV